MNELVMQSDGRREKLAGIREQERLTRRRIHEMFPDERAAVEMWCENMPVALVLGAPRGGTSAFKAALARHGRCLAMSGEHRLFFTLQGANYPDGGDEMECSNLALSANQRAEVLEMIFTSAFLGPEQAHPSDGEATRYAWEWAYRLPMQWTGLKFDPDEIARLVLAAVSAYADEGSGSLDRLDRLVLAALKERYPQIDLSFYDLEGFDRPQDGWATAQRSIVPIVEISPFVIPRPRQLKTAAAKPAVLLLKASSDPFRLLTLRNLFNDRPLHVLRLTRNPFASINGLLDGWAHHCFWQHDLRSEKDVASSLAGWCFDLFPGWRQFAAKSDMLEICLQQWLAPNAIVEDGRQKPAANERWSIFAFEDFVRSPQDREAMLTAAARAVGLETDGSLAHAARKPTVVNATAPSKAARWRDRSRILMPLLERDALVGAAANLGYRKEKLDEWI